MVGDKRKVLFPLLLFAILFTLIAITGFIQITIIRQNIEGLLRDEAEILFKSISREIDVNTEYLDLLERSPSLITPTFLNLMAYDEAIVEDLYLRIRDKDPASEWIPVSSLLLTDSRGNPITRRGSIRVPRTYIEAFTRRNEQTVVRMPTQTDPTLFVGMRMGDGRLLFFDLDAGELDALRNKFILKTILDSEGKRLNIAGINVYDPKGKPYLGSGDQPKDVLVFRKPLESKDFQGYTVEILVSRALAHDTFRRTSFSFVVLLMLLLAGGAAGIWIIFMLERRHASRLAAMEKDMERKERLVSLGKLSSGMAHEIRNPLNAISISIQRLKREFAPEPEKQEEYFRFIDIVRAELLRVNRIVEDFLLSTRAQAPREQEKVYTIVDEVTTILREKAQEKGIQLVNRVDGSLVIECQKERLKQAFYNLILNAIEAIGQNGTVQVSAQVHDATARIIIHDNGPGIAPEILAKIFEYYYTTKDKGIGIGLPISYMVVKDHGGDIQVTSEQGKGTTFTVSLPLEK